MIDALRRLPVLETATFVAATLILVAAGVLRERDRSSAVDLDSFSSYDARGGGYRAFYDLLEREGVHVDRFARRAAFLDASIDTLVWAEPPDADPRRTRVTRADAAALEGWVRAGGRLLYLGRDDAAMLRGPLGLPASRGGSRGTPLAVIRSLRDAGVRRPLSATALRWQRTRRQVRELLYDRSGAVALEYALGRGSIVAVVDARPFANAHIASDDRARLAYALARPRGPSGWVAFDEALHGHAVPEHWWSIVPRALALALAVAVAALLAGFAGAALRLGPPLDPRPRDDRSSADFIDAVATLLERGGAAATALQDAARSTTLSLGRTLPLADETSGDDLTARMESPRARADFEALLASARNPAPNEADFVRGVALAHRLRKECTAHGRPRY